MNALRSYLRHLAAENTSSDSAIRSALGALLQALELIGQQASLVTAGDPEPQDVLAPLLVHLRRIEVITDELFSRGHALAVPRPLRTMTRRELERLGLFDQSPLLVLGPPQNFETYVTDLREILFDPELLDLVKLPTYSDKLSVILLPYLEGTSPLWQPLTIGHELAHLAEADRESLHGLPFHEWIEQGGITLEQVSLPMWLKHSLNPLVGLIETLTNWVTEIFCDVHTVRRFGPAGFAAVSEFLCSINALDKTSGSHPSGCIRIRAMHMTLRGDFGAYSSLIDRWAQMGDQRTIDALRQSSDITDQLAAVIFSHISEIEESASNLAPEAYPWWDRQEIAEDLAHNFANFVPAVECDTTPGELCRPEDILNAGWLARVKGESAEAASDPRFYSGASSRSASMLQEIVAKALSDQDISSAWRDHAEDEVGGEGSGSTSTDETPPAVPGRTVNSAPERDHHALVIDSRRHSYMSRTVRDHPQEPLIITPRLTTDTHGTSIDVRLSTKFITFKRSSTPVFDALDKSQDPRKMQDLVEKDWADRFILHPLEMVLASTLEYLVMPPDLSAQVITRSSHGRLGLLTATAIQVHPRFKGCLTLELVNLGQVPLSLIPGERIAQLVFSEVPSIVDTPSTKYEYPTGPQFSRIARDSDLARLQKIQTARSFSNDHPRNSQES